MSKTGFSMVLAVALLAACGKEEIAKAPEEMRTVRVLQVAERQTARHLAYAGEVRARYETRLAFRVGGKLTDRSVQVGSRVKAGQQIARIDTSDFQLAADSARAQVVSAEADRALADADLKRYRNLRDKNFISQAEYERRAQALAVAQARLEAVRAQHRQTENQALYGTLRTDAAGVITGVEADAGQVVAAGQTVARLARAGEKEVAFAVPESHRGAFQRAGGFKVEVSALPGRSWNGKLRELSPAADPATRTYAARVSILDAPEALELGMSARVEASTAVRFKGIELPLAALYSRGDTPQVYVLQRDDTVKLQPIKVGSMTEDGLLVESGLQPGDRVVTAGAQLLRPGQRVKPAVEKIAAEKR